MLASKGGLIMIKLNTPARILKIEMYHLILDNQCEEIKLLLFKGKIKIPTLYREMKSLLESNRVLISESYFKNMLMNSKSQKCNWEKRLKVVSLVFENLDPDKINAFYEGKKYSRDKKIRSIMRVLKTDHIDKKEYLPNEIIMHTLGKLPKDMEEYWDIEQDEKLSR
jgi:hypothetical protein